MKRDLLLPKSNLMLASVAEISQVTAPLKDLGITAFSHTRIYPDGTFFDMSDRLDMLEYFYYKTETYKYYSPDFTPEKYDNGYAVCSTKLMEYTPLVDFCNDLNIDNSIAIIENYETHYEVWTFASWIGNTGIINFYLNNLANLKLFALNFKEKMQKLILAFEKDRMIINSNAKSKMTNTVSLVRKNDFYQKLAIKKFYFGRGQRDYLTLKEAEYLYWAVKGKSMEEIAIIFGISRRTVEGYFAQIKSKLQCYKITELIHKACRLHILEYFDNL